MITAPVFKVYFGNSARPNAWKNNNYNIVNILSFRKGTHSFKFGFDGKRNHVNWVAASAPTGNWDIRGTYAQNRWAELLLGLVSNVNAQPFANWQYLRRSLVGFYLQPSVGGRFCFMPGCTL